MLFIFVDHVFLILFVVVASLGTSINLNCALPIPDRNTVHWQKRAVDNRDMYIYNRLSKYEGLGTKTLTIHNIVYNDAGIYTCGGYVNGQYKRGQPIVITLTGKLCPVVYKIQDFHRGYANIVWRIYHFIYKGKDVNTVLLYSITCLNWNIKKQNNRTLWIPNIYFEYLQKTRKIENWSKIVVYSQPISWPHEILCLDRFNYVLHRRGC